MLVFVVPLRSRAASRDWKLVSQLCARTVRSAVRQENTEARVILACREEPEADLPAANVDILQGDEEVPETAEEQMIDKYRKLRRGLLAARELMPARVMLLDADDCVSKHLGEMTASEDDLPGWQSSDGYIYDERADQLMLKKGDFPLFCGSSTVLRCEADDLPQSLDESDRSSFFFRYGHHTIHKHFEEKGTPLQSLPRPGSLYLVSHGESYSGFGLGEWKSRRQRLEKLLGRRRFTPALREEFGYEPIQGS